MSLWATLGPLTAPVSAGPMSVCPPSSSLQWLLFLAALCNTWGALTNTGDFFHPIPALTATKTHLIVLAHDLNTAIFKSVPDYSNIQSDKCLM